MKKAILLWLSFLLSIAATIAQDNLPPVFEISTDTALFTPLPNEYWQMLEDGGKLSLEDVTKSPIADKFHFDTTKDRKFNFSIHTYWFRYRLKNVMDRDAEIGFGTNSEQSKFYLFKNGKWTQFENGILNPSKKLNGLQSNRYIPMVLKPGEELIVYNRVHDTYNRTAVKSFVFPGTKISIGFNSTKKATAEKYVQDESLYTGGVHNSILFGILLFAGLFNFFFFLIVRERVYLYFSLYVIFLGVGRMVYEFYYVFLREFRVLWAYLFPFVWAFTQFILTFFIRALLGTRHYLPRWDKFLNGLNYLSFILSLNVIFFPSLNSVGEVVWTLLVICNLLSFFLILNKSRDANKVLMIAILPAFCIWGIGVLLWVYIAEHHIIFSVAFSNWWFASWNYVETFCLSWLVLFYSWVLLQRFRQLQKQIVQQALEKEKEKSQLIEQQKVELEKTVEERTAELKHSLENLQSTQTQLIQSEKMASLGELTAGIAHEIQNPLNFVNNFSETNKELIEELQTEAQIGNIKEVIAIAEDIKSNEEKIAHHGRRADSIVKGMLQHAGKNSSEKQPTDINKLADEYLRLSYQGMRAKDKVFSARLEIHFDEAVAKINAVPQDLGRVLLNLFNNAFYAVNQKSKQVNGAFEPIISVTTKRLQDKVEITVKDNGTGIPQKAIDKIFQPFFTTKPTGEGTGLGLSLSYDIVTKGHGGNLTVQSTEGEGSVFVVVLPVQNM